MRSDVSKSAHISMERVAGDGADLRHCWIDRLVMGVQALFATGHGAYGVQAGPCSTSCEE